MLSVRNSVISSIAAAFLSENIQDTCICLNECGIVTNNEDGTYKTFDEVMRQIYNLHLGRSQTIGRVKD